MKIIKTAILLFLIIGKAVSYAQKPVLINTSYADWPSIHRVQISPDGKYVSYDVSNFPAGETTTFIKATSNSWEIKSTAFRQVTFTADSKSVYCIEGDNLVKIVLGRSGKEQIAKVKNFQLTDGNYSGYLLYRIDSLNTFIAKNLLKRTEVRVPNVNGYKLSPAGNRIVLNTQTAQDSNQALSILDLATGKIKQVYNGSPASNIIFDNAGESIAFTTQENSGTALWYCKSSSSSAIKLLENKQVKAEQKIDVDYAWAFSEDGKKLYFRLPPQEPPYQNSGNGPEIWNYQDRTIFPEFKQQGFKNILGYLATIDVSTAKVVQLLFGHEQRVNYSVNHPYAQFVMKVADPAVMGKMSYYIVDENTGTRSFIKSSLESLSNFNFSPDGRYLTYYDSEKLGYRCFEKASQTTYDFGTVSPELYLYDQRTHQATGNYKGIIGWIKGSSHVLMQGMYGIWELDVTNKDQPRQLTFTNSSNLHTFFSVDQEFEHGIIDPAKDIYLHGLNNDTKAVSLYRLNIRRRSFAKLYTGDFFWGLPYDEVDKDLFQQATDAQAFVMMFPTVEKTANLVFTKDFKHFNKLTSFHPEEQYNWISSELHTYKGIDSNTYQGILYKPENFDPKKKYPVIFYFYQSVSNELHEYIGPQPVGAGINIPFLVSNGYLVFRPDIHIGPNRFGEELLISIGAAADHLTGFNWVDPAKLALSGHSYGGLEVNYLITRTDRFACALSGAGVSNMVSYIFDLGYRNEEVRSFARQSKFMGVEFEDNPQLYVQNSPIFFTKDVRTPVLLVHSENDRNVLFYHSKQFFLSLRHLGKPSWLLSYQNGGHGVGGLKNKIDYANRVKEFFDYYLKEKPEPDWMSRYIVN